MSRVAVASNPVETVLSRLDNPKRQSGGWQAKCPAHDDRHASLTIKAGEGGKAVLFCHAGCTAEGVVTSIGLTLADLFPPREMNGHSNSNGHAKRIVETYPYSDADGVLLYEAVRYEPKDFRQRRPSGSGGWIWNLDGVKRVIYRLPELLNARDDRPDDWRFVVEGEKDADRLALLGLVSTCNVGGAGKWKDEYSDVLAGCRVAIFGDNDEAGRKHAQAVAASVCNTAIETRVVELPGLPPKGDVSDWVDAGGTAEQLIELVESSPIWTASQLPVEKKNLDRAAQVASEDAICLVLDPSNPRETAQKFHGTFYKHKDGPTLYSDGSTCWAWETSRYPEKPIAAIRAQVWEYQASAQKIVTRGENEQIVPFKPTSATVSGAIDALHGLAYIGKSAPCWLSDDPSLPDPIQIIPAVNGLIQLCPKLGAKLFRPPTPLFFSHNAIDFAFDPNAPDPLAWLQFLDLLWRDDPASIELLQMWFGYCITSDTRMEKLLMLIGPKRAGKGTIARVLSQLIGIANVCGPTLSGLASHFGLWGLMGKQLAIIDDARLSNRSDQAIITERILTITGGGAIEIHRKNLPPKTERIGARLMMLTNELPRLSDASGALASRFLILKLTESFYGREDIRLAERLAKELPGILLWAIEGWRKLRSLGKFTVPKTSEDAVDDLNDLASPISAFVRDYCILATGAEIKTSDLFDGWKCWCKEQGRDHAGNLQSFGRDLKAALSSVTIRQTRKDDVPYRAYTGIILTESAKAAVALERSRNAVHAAQRVVSDSRTVGPNTSEEEVNKYGGCYGE